MCPLVSTAGLKKKSYIITTSYCSNSPEAEQILLVLTQATTGGCTNPHRPALWFHGKERIREKTKQWLSCG